MKTGLGKGLDALFGEEIEEKIEKIEGKQVNSVVELKITQIEPNINQPRKDFNEEKINELAESIKENGLIQPIVVTKANDTYKIIAGERRWRAARVAGLKQIPVVIKNEIEDKKILQLALVENIQRQDLNVIEEAIAYQTLLNEHGMTQEKISQVVGKNRSTIANIVRLLSLDRRVQDMVESERISEAHARSILGITSKDKQYEIALMIEKKGLTVRDVEMFMRRKKKAKKGETLEDVFIKNIEDDIKSYLGTKVKIVSKNKEKGKIVIEYLSNDDLDRIIEVIGMKKEY